MANFNHLPTEIVLDILTRLPTESVLDCKLVCKPWRNIVSRHPSFSHLHLIHLNRSIDSAGKLGFLVFNENNQFYYFEYNNNDETPAAGRIRRINLTSPIAYVGRYGVLGSFNGLVCLYEYRFGTVCICNPLTKEYVQLPEIIRDLGSVPWTRGFGYLPSTNEYKVVEIYRLTTDFNIVEVLVYTIGSRNGWRNVGRFDIQSGEAGYVQNSVFVNGALHWLEITQGRVYVFDLSEEKFCEHVSPPPRRPGSSSYGFISIGVPGGVLDYGIKYYCRITKCMCYDIWPLDQVEQETLGWGQEFVFRRRQPFGFTKSGGVLYFDNRSLGIYDAVTSTSKELVCFSGVSQIYPHKNTFVSLKELGEDDVKIMDSGISSEDRKPCFSATELAR